MQLDDGDFKTGLPDTITTIGAKYSLTRMENSKMI